MGIKRFLAIGLAIGVPSLSYADGPEFQAGVGIFNNNLNYYSDSADVDAFGFSFQARSVFAEHFALDAALQYAPYVEKGSGNTSRSVDNVDSYTYYANLLITTGIYQNSFYGFTGVGYFSDSWKTNGVSSTSRGLQLPFGMGYQFQKLALELQFQLRDPDGYDVNRATNISVSVLGSF
jgi:hypothetical protein